MMPSAPTPPPLIVQLSLDLCTLFPRVPTQFFSVSQLILLIWLHPFFRMMLPLWEQLFCQYLTAWYRFFPAASPVNAAPRSKATTRTSVRCILVNCLCPYSFIPFSIFLSPTSRVSFINAPLSTFLVPESEGRGRGLHLRGRRENRVRRRQTSSPHHTHLSNHRTDVVPVFIMNQSTDSILG